MNRLSAIKPEHKLPLGTALLLLLTAVVYLPAILHGGFVWDDEVMLTENPVIKSSRGLYYIWLTTVPNDYFPLTLSSLWFEWRFFGENPIGYHAINVLLHGIASVLLWRVLRRLKVPGAFVIAAVFAVHPVCVASVAWISERKNTLSLVFYLLSILWYLRFDKETDSAPTRHPALVARRFYWLSLGAFLLALLAKTSVVMLPVVLMLCLWWRRGSEGLPRSNSVKIGKQPWLPFHLFSRQDMRNLIPFFVLSLVLGLVTVWFQKHRGIGPTESDPMLVRVLGGGWAVWFYLSTTFWPVGLTMIYPRWEIHPSAALAYLPGLAWLLALGVLWLNRRRAWARAIFFALAYFYVTLLPVLGFFDMAYFAYSRVADHLQYVSLIGVTALVVGGVSWRLQKFRFATNPITVAAFAAIAVLTLGAMTFNQAKLYRDAETLWRDNMKKNPRAWAAVNNLGSALAEQGRIDEALTNHLKAVEIKSDYAAAVYNIGRDYAKLGQIEKARHYYNEALQLDPKYARAYNNLGNICEREGKVNEAITNFLEALRLQPKMPEANNNLGSIYLRQGKTNEAWQLLTTALSVRPDMPEAHFNVGNLLGALGRYDDAINEYLFALRLRPDYPEAHYNVGNLLAQAGRIEEARSHFEQAIRLKPDFAEAHSTLGILQTAAGNIDEAQAHFARATEAVPNNARALFAYGMVMLRLNKLDDAIERFSAALKIEPNFPAGHFQLGNAWFTRGNMAEARAQFAEALRLKADFPEAHFQLAMTFLAERKSAEAVSRLKEAARLKPDWREAHNNLAWILATDKDPAIRNGAEAVPLAQRAVELSGGKDPENLDTLAAALAEAGRFAEAAETIRKAMQLAQAGGRTNMITDLHGRLALYESGKPYRDL